MSDIWHETQLDNDYLSQINHFKKLIIIKYR